MSEIQYSIVTICFNSLELLKRTESSISQLVGDDFEWIVIDGGSSDGTLDFLKSHETITKWVSEPDDGIADAWNKGILISSGKYILLLNSGDEYYPSILEEISSLVVPNKILCCNANISNENMQTVNVFKANPTKLWRGMHLPHNWCVVPAALYKKYGLYSKIPYSMDFEWFHRYYKSEGAAGFVVLNKTLGTYYLGGLSDAFYVKGFDKNREILVENGFNKHLAWVICSLYKLNHFLHRN